MMQGRNDAWIREHNLCGAPYHWHLDTGTLIFERPGGDLSVVLCVVGSVSACEGTFLWSWANDAIPLQAKAGIEKVRAFGTQHSLSLLTTAEWKAGHADGLEMLVIASRVLDATAAWVAPSGDVTFYFALFNPPCTTPKRQPWWRKAGTA